MRIVLWLAGALALVGVIAGAMAEDALLILFYGKPVFVDTSPEALARAEQALRLAGIKYALQTSQSRPGAMQGCDAASMARSGHVLRQSQVSGPVGFVYSVYVPRSKREQALKLI